MPEPTARKTFKYKLNPTPAQAVQLGAILRVCRELYNAALQERRDAWNMRHESINYRLPTWSRTAILPKASMM